MHGLADVQHGVEDDRVSGGLQLVSARDKMIEITLGDTFVRRLFFFNDHSIKLLLNKDLHYGSADLHPHAVLLEHVEERQETLLGITEVSNH